MNIHDLLFWFFSIAMLACGFLVIANRNPVTSAMFLVLTIISMTGPNSTYKDEFVEIPAEGPLPYKHIQVTTDLMVRYGVGKLKNPPRAADWVKLELLQKAKQELVAR